MDAITYGDEGDAGPHNDAYFKWYRGITRQRIGHPTSGNTQDNLNSVSSQVNSITLLCIHLKHVIFICL